MELIQKVIRYNQEGKKVLDQFYLDEDYNVPDAKEDVRRIVEGQGEVKIEDVKLVENYVRVSGKLYFQILYLTDQGEPRPAVLEGKLPFEEMVYTDGEENAQYFVQNIRVDRRKNNGRSGKYLPGLQETTGSESFEITYGKKRYLPDQRRDHTSGNERKYRADASDQCDGKKTGNPGRGRRTDIKR